MDSGERLLKALNRQEPDRVPLGLDLPPDGPQLCGALQQLLLLAADVLGRMDVEVRSLSPLNSHNGNVRPIIPDLIQPDVPPENILTMLDGFQEYGVYGW